MRKWRRLKERSKNEGYFDDAIMRIINENSRTLKFRNYGFEE